MELSSASKSTPKFSFAGYKVVAKCVNVYDGDTAQFVFRTPNITTPSRFSCRFRGVNTPEIKGGSEEDKKRAREARDWLKSKILDRIVTLRLGEFDKYGRVLVDVYLDDEHLNAKIIELGLGVEYMS